MAGGGDYDRHSEYQMRGALSQADLIAGAARRIAADHERRQVVIADYGSAQGAVSNALIKMAVESLRADNKNVPICVYHNDVLANDWQTLVDHLRDDESYLRVPGGPITPLMSATSFYEPVAPAHIVDLGMSFAAIQWLSAPGPSGCGSALYFDQLQGGSRDAMASQAHTDWTCFLERRAEELAPGGRMVVDMMGVGDGQVAAGHDAWQLVRSIVEELATEGLIDSNRLDDYVMPVYERTIAEVERPFGADIGARLRLEHLGVADSPNPAAQRYEESGDAAAFAREFGGFFRAFSEPSLRAGLGLDDAASEALYSRLTSRIQATAPDFSFVVHVITAVFSAIR